MDANKDDLLLQIAELQRENAILRDQNVFLNKRCIALENDKLKTETRCDVYQRQLRSMLRRSSVVNKK